MPILLGNRPLETSFYILSYREKWDQETGVDKIQQIRQLRNT